MRKKIVEVTSEAGLHAREASDFVNTAQRFKSDIQLSVDGKTVDGKSILGILSMGIAKGAKIELILSGTDEEEALEALSAIV